MKLLNEVYDSIPDWYGFEESNYPNLIGLKYETSIITEQNPNGYDFKFIATYEKNKERCEIEFNINNTIEKQEINDTALTLKALAYTVFLANKTLERLKNVPLQYIFFESSKDEPSRIKLYNRYAKTMSNVLNFDLQIITDSPAVVEYRLLNKKNII